MEYNCILIRHGEIALKGRNKDGFELLLKKNIDFAAKRADKDSKTSRIYSGYIIENFSDDAKIAKEIETVFGISNFCKAVKVNNDLEEIKSQAEKIALDKNPKSFRITAKRSNKNFKYSSTEIGKLVGEFIFEKLKIPVNLTKPDLTIYIDVSEKFTFVYPDKIAGLGGLPVGCSGEVISMISGGIDSPVASYLANKRGCHITYVTFESYPFTSMQAVEKVKELVTKLSSYQNSTTLFVVPFSEIQKEIKAKCMEKNRTILYRRMMVKIANRIAEKIRAEALVTGESVGQVASQTISNISCVEESSKLLILRPLICFDKQEIINIAQRIGTYDISIKPHQDCCTVFQPENPAIHAKLPELLADESKIDVEFLLSDALERNEIIKF